LSDQKQKCIGIGCNKWTHGHRCVVTLEQTKLKWGSEFGCLLCNAKFLEGNGFRFVFANYQGSVFNYGNFFVCDLCDKGDVENLRLANEIVETIKLHSFMSHRMGRK